MSFGIFSIAQTALLSFLVIFLLYHITLILFPRCSWNGSRTAAGIPLLTTEQGSMRTHGVAGNLEELETARAAADRYKKMYEELFMEKGRVTTLYSLPLPDKSSGGRSRCESQGNGGEMEELCDVTAEVFAKVDSSMQPRSSSPSPPQGDKTNMQEDLTNLVDQFEGNREIII